MIEAYQASDLRNMGDFAHNYSNQVRSNEFVYRHWKGTFIRTAEFNRGSAFETAERYTNRIWETIYCQ